MMRPKDSIVEGEQPCKYKKEKLLKIKKPHYNLAEDQYYAEYWQCKGCGHSNECKGRQLVLYREKCNAKLVIQTAPHQDQMYRDEYIPATGGYPGSGYVRKHYLKLNVPANVTQGICLSQIPQMGTCCKRDCRDEEEFHQQQHNYECSCLPGKLSRKRKFNEEQSVESQQSAAAPAENYIDLSDDSSSVISADTLQTFLSTSLSQQLIDLTCPLNDEVEACDLTSKFVVSEEMNKRITDFFKREDEEYVIVSITADPISNQPNFAFQIRSAV